MSFEVKITGQAEGAIGEKVRQIAHRAFDELSQLEGATEMTLSGYVSDVNEYSQLSPLGHGEPSVTELSSEQPTTAPEPAQGTVTTAEASEHETPEVIADGTRGEGTPVEEPVADPVATE